MCSWFSDETKTESTQKTEIPKNFQNLMDRTISFANQGLDTPFTAYQGDRIAGLSNNEQMGSALAAGNAGMYQDVINMAMINNADMQNQGGLPNQSQLEALMNPYVNSVLGNSMNRLNEQSQKNMVDINSLAAKSSAFGGSRHGVLEGANLAELLKSTAELSSNTYADAYDKSMGNWFKGQALRSGTINDALNIAGKGQAYNQGDIDALMNTGKTGRTVDQAEKDFGYSEFLRELADPYAKASFAGGIMAQYPRDLFTKTSETTQTSTPSILSSAIGLGTMAAGLMTGGAAGAAGMASGAQSLGSQTPSMMGGSISAGAGSASSAGSVFSNPATGSSGNWFDSLFGGGKAAGGEVKRYAKGGKVKKYGFGGMVGNQTQQAMPRDPLEATSMGFNDTSNGGWLSRAFQAKNMSRFGQQQPVQEAPAAVAPPVQIDWNAFRQRHHMGEFARPQPTMGNTFPNQAAPNLPGNRPDLSAFVNALRTRLGNPGQSADPLNPGMPTPHVYKKGGKVKKNDALPYDESEIRPVADSWTLGNSSYYENDAPNLDEYANRLRMNKERAQKDLGGYSLGDLSNFTSEGAADGNASQQEYIKQIMHYDRLLKEAKAPGPKDSMAMRRDSAPLSHEWNDNNLSYLYSKLPPDVLKKYFESMNKNGGVMQADPNILADNEPMLGGDDFEVYGPASTSIPRYQRWREEARNRKYGSKYAKGGKVTGFDYSTRDGYGQAKTGNFRRPTTNAPNRDYVDPLDSMQTEYDRDVKRGDLSQILAALGIEKKQAALDLLNSRNLDAGRNARLRKGITDVGGVGERLNHLYDKHGNPAVLPPLPHRQPLPPGDDMGGPLDSSAFSPTVEDYQEFDARRERNRLIRDKLMQGNGIRDGFAKGGRIPTPRPKPTDTVLTPKQEKAFQKWKAHNAPNDSGQDYDLRGAFVDGLRPGKNGHWPDTYKMPWHPTFSNESKYYDLDPLAAGRWDGENFIPPVNGGPYKNDFEQAPQGLRGPMYAQGGFVQGGQHFNQRPGAQKIIPEDMTPYIDAFVERGLDPEEIYTLAAQKWESGASEYGNPNYQARPWVDPKDHSKGTLSSAFGVGQWTLGSWNKMAANKKNKLPTISEQDLNEGRFPSKEEQDRAWGIWQDTAKKELGARDNYLNRFAWHQLGIGDFNTAVKQDPSKKVREVLGDKIAKNVSAWNPKTGKDETFGEYFGRLNRIYSDAYDYKRNLHKNAGTATLADLPSDPLADPAHRRAVIAQSPKTAQGYDDLFGQRGLQKVPDDWTPTPQETIAAYRLSTPKDTSAHRKAKSGQTVVQHTTPNLPNKLLNDASDPLYMNTISDLVWGGQSFSGGGRVKGYKEGKTVLRDKNGKEIPESQPEPSFLDSLFYQPALGERQADPLLQMGFGYGSDEEAEPYPTGNTVTLPLPQRRQSSTIGGGNREIGTADPLIIPLKDEPSFMERVGQNLGDYFGGGDNRRSSGQSQFPNITDGFPSSGTEQGPLGLLGDPYGEDPVDNYWQHLSEMGSGASYGADTDNLLNALDQGDGSGGLTNDINAAHAAEQDALSLELKKYIASKLEDLKNTDESPDTDPLRSVFGNYNKGLFRMGLNILAARTGNAFSNIATGVLATQDQEEAAAMKKIKDKNDRFKDLLNVRYLDAMTNQMSPQTRQAIAAETNKNRYDIAKLKEQGAYARQQASFEENARRVGLKALFDKAQMGEKFTEDDRDKMREYMNDPTYPINVDTSDINESE